MGMTIDEAIKHAEEVGNGCNECAAEHRQLAEWLRKYQQLQADYETRLKADMAAMLEDLRLDFQEAELAGVFDNKELIFADEVDDLVQQKINNLKED